MRRVRRDPKMPTPDTAVQIESFSESQKHQFLALGKYGKAHDSKRIFKRSAMLAITQKDLDEAKRKRGDSRTIDQILKVREMSFEDDGIVGTRFLRCVCEKCYGRDRDKCVAKKWTGGQPKWEAAPKHKSKKV